MFTRPVDLADDEVREALARGWGLGVSAVERAPVGVGSHHGEVVTDGGEVVLKVGDAHALSVHPQVAGHTFGGAGTKGPPSALVEAHRLGWDLAHLASFAAELHSPHADDDDTRTAWAGLRAVLEGGPP